MNGTELRSFCHFYILTEIAYNLLDIIPKLLIVENNQVIYVSVT